MEQRVTNSLTATIERRILDQLVRLAPRWARPGFFTTVGIMGSLLVFTSYWAANYGHGFLWLVNLGIFLNWLGDSMDGSLARHRKIVRPRYGYFIDHAVDVVSTFLVGVGLGLSPYMSLEFALLLITGYMMMMLLVSLTTYVQDTFRLSFGRVGPTEMRLALISFNAFLFAINVLSVPVLMLGMFTVIEVAALGVGLLIVAAFILGVVEKIRELDRLDPEPDAS